MAHEKRHINHLALDGVKLEPRMSDNVATKLSTDEDNHEFIQEFLLVLLLLRLLTVFGLLSVDLWETTSRRRCACGRLGGQRVTDDRGS